MCDILRWCLWGGLNDVFRWVLVQSDWYPYKKGCLGIERHQGCMCTEERLCEDAEVGLPPCKLRRTVRPQEKPNLRILFCSKLLASRAVRNKSLIVWVYRLVILCYEVF